MKMTSIEIGSRVRVRGVLADGMNEPSFRTDRIEKGERLGTFLATVVNVCGGGCHLHVRSDGGEGVVGVDAIQPLQEGDSDGTADGEQHASVGEGSALQGLPSAPAETQGEGAMPLALPATATARERAEESLGREGVHVLRRIWAAIERALEPGSGYGIAHVRNEYQSSTSEVLRSAEIDYLDNGEREEDGHA